MHDKVFLEMRLLTRSRLYENRKSANPKAQVTPLVNTERYLAKWSVELWLAAKTTMAGDIHRDKCLVEGRSRKTGFHKSCYDTSTRRRMNWIPLCAISVVVDSNGEGNEDCEEEL